MKGDDSELSELDQKDLMLLFCGEHKNYFEAKAEFEHLREKEIEKKKQ